MRNPNTNAVLTFDEKRAATPQGVRGFWSPMVVRTYDEEQDRFLIAADTRYVEEGRDTDFLDLDDFWVPACAIHAITGADHDPTDIEVNDHPGLWEGHFFLMPAGAARIPVEA